ncbi:MAG: hypothetical protein VX589_19375 [Myxococcota bacterium]|nr:hypothetical protein [Myxococcota bacterium]
MASRPLPGPVRPSLGFIALIMGLAIVALSCTSASKAHQSLDDDVVVSRPSLQMYLVLTSDASAMQGPADVQAMWNAVHGTRANYAQIRRAVTWVPDDYRLDIELDFADLPHPAFSRSRLSRLLKTLPARDRQIGEAATLGVSVRSAGSTLTGAAQVRLVGLAVLAIAERYDGVIIDLLARRAWTPAAWRAELLRPQLSAKQVRVVGKLRAARGQLRTLGWLKFGLPDLVIREVPAQSMGEVRRILETLWFTKLAVGLQAGQRLSRPKMRSSLRRCTAALSLDGDCLVGDF